MDTESLFLSPRVCEHATRPEIVRAVHSYLRRVPSALQHKGLASSRTLQVDANDSPTVDIPKRTRNRSVRQSPRGNSVATVEVTLSDIGRPSSNKNPLTYAGFPHTYNPPNLTTNQKVAGSSPAERALEIPLFAG